jgi:hypothetical protein
MRVGHTANLVQLWLPQYDRSDLNAEGAMATVAAEYEATVVAPERKVDRLAIVLDLLKNQFRAEINTRSPRLFHSSATATRRGQSNLTKTDLTFCWRLRR